MRILAITMLSVCLATAPDAWAGPAPLTDSSLGRIDQSAPPTVEVEEKPPIPKITPASPPPRPILKRPPQAKRVAVRAKAPARRKPAARRPAAAKATAARKPPVASARKPVPARKPAAAAAGLRKRTG